MTDWFPRPRLISSGGDIVVSTSRNPRSLLLHNAITRATRNDVNHTFRSLASDTSRAYRALRIYIFYDAPGERVMISFAKVLENNGVHAMRHASMSNIKPKINLMATHTPIQSYSY